MCRICVFPPLFPDQPHQELPVISLSKNHMFSRPPEATGFWGRPWDGCFPCRSPFTLRRSPSGTQPGHEAFSGPSRPFCCLHLTKKPKTTQTNKTQKYHPTSQLPLDSAETPRTKGPQYGRLISLDTHCLLALSPVTSPSINYPVFRAFGAFLKYFIQLF